MKRIIAWTWCLPQTLIGLIVSKVVTVDCIKGEYYWKYKSGLSLGEYRFFNYNSSEDLRNHERGHTKQSYILGWLYLPAIGLPSVIWNTCFKWFRKAFGISYYSFYTEKWADRLGGVTRN